MCESTIALQSLEHEHRATNNNQPSHQACPNTKPSNNLSATVPIEHFLDSNAPVCALVPDIAEVPCNDHSCAPMHDVVQVKKSSCRPKLALHDDIVIAREVRKFRAQAALFGEVYASFAGAAQHDKKENLSTRVTVKTIQNHYKKIQDDHCNGETRSRRM